MVIIFYDCDVVEVISMVLVVRAEVVLRIFHDHRDMIGSIGVKMLVILV